MQGESRSPFLDNEKLIDTVWVPGVMFDTMLGYPAALFGTEYKKCIYGELYELSDPRTMLDQLDSLEGVQDALFERCEIEVGGSAVYSYAAGESLGEYLVHHNVIKEGDWRKVGSIAKSSPLDFAINFENSQKSIYKEHPETDRIGAVHVRGDIPVLVTAPHATAHVREGKLKRQEFYTGALVLLMNILEGSHALYTNRLSEIDPNYEDDCYFKDRLTEIVNAHDIRFVLDLHGTGKRHKDIYPGVGESNEFLLGHEGLIAELNNAIELNGISIGDYTTFPASKQMTVTKFAARKLGVPAMQLELNDSLRRPLDNRERFLGLVKFLRDFVTSINDLSPR